MLTELYDIKKLIDRMPQGKEKQQALQGYESLTTLSAITDGYIHKKPDIDDGAWEFIEALEFDQLKPWCEILDVCYEEPPLDDLWPDWEGELRGELLAAMLDVGIKPESED